MEKPHNNAQHKRAFIIWVAIYPLITLLQYLFGNTLHELPMPLRTLILTLIAVPIMFYLLVPLLNHLFNKWLQ